MAYQPLQVFISSKMEELAPEREAIKAALAEHKIEAWVFEKDAGARSQSIQQTFIEEIEAADLYIGIFWKGYGAYTIEEFEHAQALGMDCLIYEKRDEIEGKRAPELQAFLDQIGAVEEGVSTARRFTTPAELGEFVKEDVAAWVARIVRERGKVGAPAVHVGVPALPTIPFVGREQLVFDLVRRLRSGKEPVLSVEGLPGVGKTTLAIALVRHPGVLRYFRDGVLWAGLGPEADVMSALDIWAKRLDGDISSLANVGERAQAVKDAIGRRRMLLVIDDAWNLDAALALRCGGPSCCHLLTTRDKAIAQGFAGSVQSQNVPTFDDDTSCRLLAKLAPEAYATDAGAVETLARAVGGLPLALGLVGGYLGALERSMFSDLSKEALEEMADPKHRLRLAQERLGTLKGEKVSMEDTVALSLEGLPEEAVRAFYALGAFAPKPEWFSRDAAQAVTETGAKVLAVLGARNLVEISADKKHLTVHQLLAEVARTKTDEESRARHRAYYLALVNENWEDWLRIEQAYGQIKWAWESMPEDASLLDWVRALRIYQERRGLWQDYLDWANRGLWVAGEEGLREDEGALLNNIGGVYDNLGQGAEALEYFENALPILEEVGNRYGLAATLNNIGAVYVRLGQGAKALEYFENALPILEEVGDRYGLAGTLNNIGIVYLNLGQGAKALEYFENALPIQEEVGDRYSLATTLSNIGMVYNNLGQGAEALEYYEKALPIREEVGDRYGLARTLTNIGMVYDNLGQGAEALEYYENALPIQEEVGDRYGLAATLNNIGLVYHNLGQGAEALEYYENALLIREEVGDRSGESTTRYNMAMIYRDQGRLAEAVSELKKVVELDRLVVNPKLEDDMARLAEVEAELARQQE